MNPASTRHELSRESIHPPSRTTSQSELGDVPSRSESLVSITSVAPPKKPPLSATSFSRSTRSVHREQSVSKLPPTKPTQRQKAPPGHVSKKIKIRASFKRRAEGRAKVPKRLRDSSKHFIFSSAGVLKVLRMCIIAASVVCFVLGGAHEMFVAITIQETCIVLFFIIVYLVTLQHLLICVQWPLLDLINSIISTVFLGVVAILTMQEKERKHWSYVGGILCLSAAILCLIDALLVIKNMNNMEKSPGNEN
ncbi:CKLF-like MARVEL transmembrane domain-containing protein 2 isoform X2 [Peromyscus eremicus]|uniref:CKLF-like MARVEL transmembrane domain-containing protein 2 isoform X1 n=1 Tax=Peromyscus eremicus TaxID=42410 RepID=UPI0027DD214E|nr:CKLF-like MARVEL transmembrane domain-containing protein 2 isoform X1 [Peromyscus eremicus]XP_059120228.1 CKLF-like MARVEL transmembrane domain-containing protein 2 isoform X2 [Peromyscus eremicus]